MIAVRILVMVFLFIVASFGQYIHAYDYGKFRDDCEVYAFQDPALVYFTPSIDGRSIDQLPLSFSVIITGAMEHSDMVNGYVQNWYGVSYEKDGEKRTGYMLDGSLAMAATSFYWNGKEAPLWFLWSITGYDEDHFWQSQAKVVDAGEEVSFKDFDPIYTDVIPEQGYSYTVDVHVRDGSGIAEDLSFFVIDYIYEACGFVNGSIYLTWNGEELNYGFETVEISEAGVFCVWTEVAFPEDENGQPGKIVVTEVEEEFAEEIDDYVVLKKVTRIYSWDGEELIAEE